MRKSVRSILGLCGLALVLGSLAGCRNPFTTSGLLYNDLMQYRKAESCFRRALEENPKDAEAAFNLGRTMSARGEEDLHYSEKTDDELKADKQLQKDKNQKARLGDLAAFRTASFDSAKVKLHESTQMFRHAAALDSVTYAKLAKDNIQSNYSRAFNRAVSLKDQQRMDDSARYFELAYAIDSAGDNGVRARRPIVQVQLLMAKNELASLKENDNPQTRALAEQRVDNAIKIIDEMMVSAPDAKTKRSLTEDKIKALRLVDRNAEAAALKDQLLVENPNDVDLLYQIANERMAANKFSEAADLYQRAVVLIEQDPGLNESKQYDDLYYLLGLNLFQIGTPEGYQAAIAPCEKALTLAATPDSKVDICETLALSNFELEHYEDAIKYAKQVVETKSTNSRAWAVLCRSYSRNNQPDLAKDACAHYDELRGGQPGS